MDDVVSRSGDRLEGDRPLPPQPRREDLEHLSLLHEVSLDALVHRPVEAGAVLGGHADNQVA